jgi:membrane protein YqaA with SNARE-associated domain
MAEAIFFFLVPDVLLTLIAARALRPAIKATLAALAGALVGGAMMYAFGSNAPDKAKAFLDYIPAISPQLIERVVFEIDQHGLMAVMLGPIKGIPYKIYAVEWGLVAGASLLSC